MNHNMKPLDNVRLWLCYHLTLKLSAATHIYNACCSLIQNLSMIDSRALHCQAELLITLQADWWLNNADLYRVSMSAQILTY